MESWHLPNLSVQIAPDCISEYLNFQNFPGGHVWMTDIEGFLTIYGHSDNLLNNN